ncbi:MAG TPA: zf-HC2 domain-containing protein [Limnochordales bacterium]|mgnify:CR=1 FL=1
MRCPGDELLQMFTEGELDPAAGEIVKVHLRGCSRCQAAVARYKQLLWDLEHPEEPPLPPELVEQEHRLMQAWAEEHKAVRQRRRALRLVPAWAGYGILWTRYVPPVERFGRFLSRTGRSLLASRVPFARRLLEGRR